MIKAKVINTNDIPKRKKRTTPFRAELKNVMFNMIECNISAVELEHLQAERAKHKSFESFVFGIRAVAAAFDDISVIVRGERIFLVNKEANNE